MKRQKDVLKMATVLSCVLVRRSFLCCNGSLKSLQIPKKTAPLRWFKSNPSRERTTLGRVKRVSLIPIEDETVSSAATFRNLLKPFLFTVSVCGCSYVGATLWQYENVRKYALRMNSPVQYPQTNYKQSSFRRELNRLWNGLSEGQKVAVGIIAANGLVFVLWRIPALQSSLVRYFSSSPASKATCWPMLLSTFSHYSFFHLAANMYVLYSFSTPAVSLFGKEQFLGFYLSAGVVSSFVSYVHKVVTRSPSASLGASGALLGVLSAVCFQFPQAQLSIIFLPFFTFHAGTAIKCVMGLDAVGMALGWKFFDHAAHLGGALFGAAYLWYGQDLVWKKREPLLHWWHRIRNQGRDS